MQDGDNITSSYWVVERLNELCMSSLMYKKHLMNCCGCGDDHANNEMGAAAADQDKGGGGGGERRWFPVILTS